MTDAASEVIRPYGWIGNVHIIINITLLLILLLLLIHLLCEELCTKYNLVIMSSDIHCVSKKVPTFKLSVTLSNLNRFFQNFCTAEKPMKFATKFMRQCPPHLKHVATLPWDIKNSNFVQIFSRSGKMQTNCVLSLSTLLFIHKFWYFRCLR